MRHLLTLILILCFTPDVFAKNSQTTIQIIFDDSGVLIEAENADQYKILLLSHIRKLVRKRKFANSHIDVISSSIGRTIWSGVPMDLKRKPARALALIEAIKTKSENCNNLPASFQELSSNLRALKRQGYKEAHVIVFSSLIHTPRPCDKTSQIILPQTPPQEGNINSAISSLAIVRSINFFWISPHQMRVWEEFLKPTFNWAALNNIPFKFLDIERSKFSLERGLKLGVTK